MFESCSRLIIFFCLVETNIKKTSNKIEEVQCALEEWMVEDISSLIDFQNDRWGRWLCRCFPIILTLVDITIALSLWRQGAHWPFDFNDTGITCNPNAHNHIHHPINMWHDSQMSSIEWLFFASFSLSPFFRCRFAEPQCSHIKGQRNSEWMPRIQWKCNQPTKR